MSTRSGSGAGAVARALVTTAEIMALTSAAHTLAGGTLPPVASLAGPAAAVLVANLCVLRGALRVRTAVPLLLVCQVALHEVYELGTAPMPMPMPHGAHGHDPVVALPMVLAHLLTIVVTTLLLLTQERAVVLARDWLDARSRGGVLVVCSTRRTAPAAWGPRLHGLRDLLVGAPRRGPPAGLRWSPA